LVMLPMLSNFIWPRFKQVMEEMEAPIPAFSAMVFEDVGLITGIEAALLAALVFIAFVYVGGPRVKNLFRLVTPILLLDALLLRLPWRRHRMQRDFTGVLAILLDAGVPEARAVELAGRAPANAIFEWRARSVVAALRNGVALPEALRFIERDTQFQWRWKNALRGGIGFFAALRGWHDTLEARAFQQEQAAAHAITSGIVIINGAVVAAIACAIFLALLSILDVAVLW
jgi:type II secretory pathway component PulF